MDSAFFLGGYKVYIGQDEVLFENYSDKSWYIYIPTRGLITKIDQKTYEDMRKNWKEELPDYLRKYPFINVKDINEKETGTIASLSINISDGCQLRCQYCYLSATDVVEDSLMTFDEGKNIFMAYVRYLDENYSQEIRKGKSIWISFFGGAEPTYNYNVLRKLVKYIKEYSLNKGLQVKLRITTNGFYNESIAHFIAQNFNKVLLSFDGNEKSQNLHRKVANGSDSFDKVFNTAKILYASECDFSVRMTVSSENIKYFRESLEMFSLEFPKVRVLIGKVSKIGRATDYNIDNVENFDKKLYSTIDDFKEKLNFSILEKKKINEVRTCYCGAVTGKHFIISKNNIIKVCAHEDADNIFVIGRVEGGKIILDENKIEELQNKYSVHKRQQCVECIAKYYCAGGCPSVENYSNDDYKSSCNIQKNIFLTKIKEML